MNDGNGEFHRLMERLQAGDPDAAEELYARFRPDLNRTIRKILHDRLRAQFDSVDFLQSVWAAFFSIPPNELNFSDPAAMRNFLLDVATNKVIDAWRSRYRTQRRNLNRERSLDGSANLEALRLTGPDPTPSQNAMAAEAWEHLIQDLPQLSQLILNRLHENRSHREIAYELGISERTIGRLIQKLRARQPI